MNYRDTAVIATIANSFCDATLDYAVNRFNYHKVLLITTLIAFFGQFSAGIVTNLTFTLNALPYILIHAVLILLGYIYFVRALQFIPIGLVSLIEAGSLFITFIIDAITGYIQITPYFLLMFSLFILSIILFTSECLKKEDLCLKKIKIKGFFFTFASVLLYVAAPYLVKTSHSQGANEIAINLGYYIVAIPYFAHQYLKSLSATDIPAMPQTQNYNWWNNFYFLCLIIGGLETLYYIFETFSFINDAPTIVIIIAQMRIFLVFILSVLFKMDKFTLRKAFAMILGMISVIGIYYS